MTALVVNPGSLQQIKDAGSVEQAFALKVVDLQEANGKFKCEFSDGKENMAGVITSQVNKMSVIKTSGIFNAATNHAVNF
jgi:hypothetical protein